MSKKNTRTFRPFKIQSLKFSREGNLVKGWAAPISTHSVFSGKEEFLLVARSKAGLKRQLRDLCPELKINAKAFLKVEVKL